MIVNIVLIVIASRVTLTHDFGFVALDLAYVKPEDSGTYTCKATNELGQAVCSATLAVRGMYIISTYICIDIYLIFLNR